MNNRTQTSIFDEIIVDNFAGGGGASTGIELATGRVVSIAINHDPDAFAYIFTFFRHQGVTSELARSITDEIVSRMISQSYDHGAQWRECRARSIVDDEFELSITVFSGCGMRDKG